MDLDPIDAISPVDGRYRGAAEALRPIFSERGLIRERIRVEAEWFRCLVTEVEPFRQHSGHARVLERAAALAAQPDVDAAGAVKAIEARTNHDVKAVEYYVREALATAGASPAALELVHFGCTSEDINNVAYARMLLAARQVLLTTLDARIATLRECAGKHADLAMLSRTHGQAASPTTLGKEFANVAARLTRARARFAGVVALAKWNGAVGNYNAHVAALPAIDWPALARRFVTGLGLEFNSHTTQIEPHDWIAQYCDALAAINTICIDLARDLWGYVSLGYLVQRAVAGEVGSSTMPHKVNPIDFENAEGNLGVANALLRHFADKLPVSRWQRDLTDSTVLRNLGVACAHSLIAWTVLGRGLARIDANGERMRRDLVDAHEVLTEAVQTALRAHGVAGGYELLKDFARGQAIDAAHLRALIASLPLPEAAREALAALTPADYTGLAAQLARAIARPN
jgi:adenylosuccinate lyase